MKWIKRLFNRAKKALPQKVVIHFDDGDWEPTAINGIIKVPWLASWNTVPMKLEDDGTVTLRLMWGNVPCNGYGKQYGNATWEHSK
jgi:hypothetical protein